MAKKARKPAVREFVLDGSLALAWYFKDESVPYADAVAASLPVRRARVPVIWPLEIANAVVTGERRRRSTEAQAIRWFGYLGSLPIVVDEETNKHAWNDVVKLARTHHLSAYDAAYLELALRRGLQLATLDDKLKVAASSLGLTMFIP